MPQQLDAKDVKERMLKYLQEKGPELPVRIAKHMSMNTLFTSAFLSEMASEGMIKISKMKVGGSPLYYSVNKIALLENFINSLSSKEREACILLKEKGILEDATQHPAIRVALRDLKDFAFPFKKDEKIFWRYFLLSEDEVRNRLESPIELKSENEIKIEKKEAQTEINIEKAPEIILNSDIKIPLNPELENINKELEEKKKELENIKIRLSQAKEDKKLDETPIKKDTKKSKIVKKSKIDETFLEEIKSILQKKQIEIINIENFDKKQVFLKVKINNQEYLLAAYNKKKIEDEDLIKAYKKALVLNLPYNILSKGDTSKKTKEAIEAYKKLASIEKIE
jgi:hypothetical protein